MAVRNQMSWSTLRRVRACSHHAHTFLSYTLPSTQDRVVEAGNVHSPVGHGAIKAEVARRAMETLSQHVAVIENK